MYTSLFKFKFKIAIKIIYSVGGGVARKFVPLFNRCLQYDDTCKCSCGESSVIYCNFEKYLAILFGHVCFLTYDFICEN